jgi:histone-lysine N-methyltransferase SETD1
VATLGTPDSPRYWNVKIFVQGREYIPGLKGFSSSSSNSSNRRKEVSKETLLSVDISPKRTRSGSNNNNNENNEKEEKSTHTHPPVAEDGNFYYCQVCQKPGDVVCCDGCPQVFHRDCVIHGKSRDHLLADVEPWYCPDCIREESKSQDEKEEAEASQAATTVPTRSSKRKRSMDQAADTDMENTQEPPKAFVSPRPKQKPKSAAAAPAPAPAPALVTEKTPPKPSASTKNTPVSSAKKQDKTEMKKKKKKKKKGRDAEATSPTTHTAAGAPNTTTPSNAPNHDSDTEDEDPFKGLFSSVTTGIIQATPAFYFFLAENRLKIERSLIRKHRTFNRLPKGMERNELIAKEGAHWWVKLPPNEVDRYITESMKDFEKRVVEWKEEKTITAMTNTEPMESVDTDPLDHTEDAKLTYQNHQKLYLNTTVGAKPFKPDADESNNKILLELLQDMRFHPLPMMEANRPPKEYGGLDPDKVSIPYFDVHGPVSTSIGDECLGCQRGFAHFCNVLKRNVPAVLNRARLQPPLSSLMATRIGLGFKEESPDPPKAETTEQAKDVEIFSVRDSPAISSAKALPAIPYEPLTDPSYRGDGTYQLGGVNGYDGGMTRFVSHTCVLTDIVRFIEEVVHMKVPEPQRPASPTNRNAAPVQQVAAAAAAATTAATTTRKPITSRASLPIRKLPTSEPTMDDVDGVNVVRKCGRCRTIIDGDQGCNQCRRAQLVINLSREDPGDYSVSGESGQRDAQPMPVDAHGALLHVSTIMQNRVQMKDFVPQLQSEGDEAIANHIARQRWTPYAIMPPQKIMAPVFDPSKPTADDKEDESDDGSSGGDGSDSLSSSDPMEEVLGTELEHPAKAAQCPAGNASVNTGKRSIESDADNDEDETVSASKRLRTSARITAKEHSTNTSASIYNRDGDIDSQDLDSTARQSLLKRFSKEKEDINKKCLSVACCGILLGMMRRDPLQLFAQPVEADGYNQIIKYPMDFEKMKKKLLGGTYGTFSSFLFDARMLCDNALIYNPPDSVYSKTAKELSDVLDVMKERASKWMSAIKEAHIQAFKRASKAELIDALERLDKLSPNSFMIMDSFRELRKAWPAALEMLKSHDRLRQSVESDFMRTRENETAYYGTIAIRRAAAAAAYSLAPYPDSSGIYNVVGRRSHIEDEHLREHIAQKVAQVVDAPQLHDVPTWREEMIMRVLRKAQSRRMEGMTESPSGCARCDGIRVVDQDLKSVAKSVRWGRFARRRESGNFRRVDPSRLHLSTGLGSQTIEQKLLKHREYNRVHQDELVANKTEALLAALEKVDDAAVSVRASRVHGMGLFADQPFRKGDVVAEYIGEYVSSAVTDARERTYREERIQDYQFRLDSDLVIDATKRGGHARYINHSCDPNCISKIVPGVREGLKRVVVVASRDIDPMEEFSYDYQFPLENDLEARIPCNCHSEMCRGFMNWDLPEKGSSNQDFRTQKRGANMRDRIRRLGRPLKGEKDMK